MFSLHLVRIRKIKILVGCEPRRCIGYRSLWVERTKWVKIDPSGKLKLPTPQNPPQRIGTVQKRQRMNRRVISSGEVRGEIRPPVHPRVIGTNT
jgi:hypothetical protein